MKWIGSGLVFCGGIWWWRILLRERQCRQNTLEHLMTALYQLREGIRMARASLPVLLQELADREPFFAQVLRELQQTEKLAQVWHQASEQLLLPESCQTVWSWLGGQLIGDEQHVIEAITYAERVLEREWRNMEERREDANRQTTAKCFSVMAMLVLLLL